MHDVTLILRAAVGARLVACLALWACGRWLPAFDTSAEALLGQHSQLEGFVRWDTLYFVRIASHGYTREQEHAFQPGLPMLMRYAGAALRSFVDVGETEAMVIAGIVLANGAAIASTLVLYQLTLHVSSDRTLALTTALLHCISPAPATLSVPYTEPFFALCTFAGMLLVQRGRTVIAAIAFAAATAFRATGVLNAGFIVWHCLAVRPVSRLNGVLRTAEATMLSLVVAAPFIATQRLAYLQFCLDQSPRPWCSRSPPLVYSFVQDYYWCGESFAADLTSVRDNGFLRYWTTQQSPLFVLSAPVLALSVYASLRYYRSIGLDTAIRLSVPFLAISTKGSSSSPKSLLLSSSMLLPYFHLHTALTILLLFFSHVQICLRQAATNPVVFWTAAELLLADWRASEADAKDGAKTPRQRRAWGKIWVRYCVFWGAVSLVLWATFLPPA